MVGGPLSAREAEALRLVAEGLTDGQVAEKLYISPRTVGVHLRSIYRKLAVPSQAAAVKVAVEHGVI
jgi:DNA-binding CsgD family transcriptional regulator